MHEKVVLDTNVIISSIFWEKGKSHAIAELAIKGKIMNFTSPVMLNELSDKLSGKFKQPRDKVEQQVALVARYSQTIIPTISLHVIKDDPKDNMVIECAVEGKARFIVTGDNHLFKLQSYQGIRILTPKEFLKILR